MPDLLRRQDIGAVFRFLHQRGFSGAAMAALTGLAENRVREIRQRQSTVTSYEVLVRIADGLGIDRGLLGLGFSHALVTTTPIEEARADDVAIDSGHRPVELRRHIEWAMRAPDVTIDFAGLSSETLHGVLSEPLDRIRAGEFHPTSLALRLLLPDPTEPMALPCRADTRADDPDVRRRAGRIAQRHTEAIAAAVTELGSLRLVEHISVQMRVHRAAPLFKLYILNGTRVFFGFYPVVAHSVAIGGAMTPIFDVMGKDATLFQVESPERGDVPAAAYVAQAQTWFDSMWSTISSPVQLP